MMEPLIAYLHYLSILLTAGFLVADLVTCRPGMTGEQARRLTAVDVVFFVSALAALATGLLRLFFYAKGVGFYTGNPTFGAKTALSRHTSLPPAPPATALRRTTGDMVVCRSDDSDGCTDSAVHSSRGRCVCECS
jgi:putative membrane protein